MKDTYESSGEKSLILEKVLGFLEVVAFLDFVAPRKLLFLDV